MVDLRNDPVFGRTLDQLDAATGLNDADLWYIRTPSGESLRVTTVQLLARIQTEIDDAIASAPAQPQLTAHLGADNPHNLTASDIGSYTRAQTDSEIANEIGPVTSALASHEARADNPHIVTAAQLSVDTSAETDAKIASATALLAPRDSPVFTGSVPRFPTALDTAFETEGVNAEWVIRELRSRYKFRATLITNQAISNGSWNPCYFDQIDYGESNDYNPVTGEWTAPFDGDFEFCFSSYLNWANPGGSSTYFGHALEVNGSTRLYSDYHFISGISGVVDSSGSTLVLDGLTAGDKVQMVAYFTNAVNCNFVAQDCYMRIQHKL